MLSNDQDRAMYGYAHVMHADENLAVEELLVTDKLFKSADLQQRKKYVDLVESVKEHSGKVSQILVGYISIHLPFYHSLCIILGFCL
jgi:stalled ribosome rescue protein Dom34